MELFGSEFPSPAATLTRDTPSSPKGKKRQGRKGFSPDIAREPIYLPLSEAEKAGAIDTFFVKVKEELDITPAKVQVLEYWQEKAVFVEQAQRRLVEAPRPRLAYPVAWQLDRINPDHCSSATL